MHPGNRQSWLLCDRRTSRYGVAYAIRRKEPSVFIQKSAIASLTTVGFVGVFTA
ncbi:MAG: hypothetical protein JWP54_2903 [Cryobacterium sp.]|jgi:hypothetical protein|nr:hypothetical protein [Cryobacterium sp.]